MKDKDYAAFHTMITTNIAKLNDVACRCTDWMPAPRRKAVIEQALYVAWHDRKQFDPEKEHITKWFERAVFAASQMRLDMPDGVIKAWADDPKPVDQMVREARKYRPLSES